MEEGEGEETPRSTLSSIQTHPFPAAAGRRRHLGERTSERAGTDEFFFVLEAGHPLSLTLAVEQPNEQSFACSFHTHPA